MGRFKSPIVAAIAGARRTASVVGGVASREGGADMAGGHVTHDFGFGRSRRPRVALVAVIAMALGGVVASANPAAAVPGGVATVGWPSSSTVGDLVVFAVSVTNTGSGPSEDFIDVSFANNGSVGLAIGTFPSSSIPAGGNAVLNVPAQIIAAPGTNADLNLSVTGITAGAGVADPTFSADGTPFSVTEAVTATLTHDRPSNTVTGADQITYTLTLTNASDTAAQITGDVLPVPTGTTLASRTNGASTLAANSTDTWSLTVNVNDNAGGTTITLVPAARYAMSAIGLAARAVSVTPTSVFLTVQGPAPATVGAPSSSTVGDLVVFAVSVTNTGSGPSEDFIDVSFANNGSVGLAIGTFPSSSIPAGGNAVLNVPAQIIAAPGTNADLNLSVTGITAGAGVADPTFSADGTPFSVTEAVTATLTHDRPSNTVTGADQITYTLTLTNASDTAAQITGDVLPVPTGTTLASRTNGASTLAANSTDTWSLTVNVNDNAGGTTITLVPAARYAMSAIGLAARAVSVTPTSVFLTVHNIANSPPSIDQLTLPTMVAEGTSAGLSVAFSDPDAGDPHTVAVLWGDGSGDATAGATSPTALSHAYADNGLYTVTVTVTDDDGGVGSDTLTVTVTNVAPTATGVAGGGIAVVGTPASFTATATDPSSVDISAGLSWRWKVDDGAFGPFGTAGEGRFTATFSACRAHTVTAQARDKDGGLSDPVSLAVTAVEAHFEDPLDEGQINVVKGGRVVPVTVTVGCAGVAATELEPRIQLLLGNVTPATETAADEVETLSSSAADTTGTMRPVTGGYRYNLRVHEGPNSQYTIRVRPFGDDNPAAALYVVLGVK
jgi:hypothetical protein